MPKKQKKMTTEEELAEALDRLAVAEAILVHALPDVDLEAEAEQVAYKRDGSAVYIGDLDVGATEVDGDDDDDDDDDEVKGGQAKAEEGAKKEAKKEVKDVPPPRGGWRTRPGNVLRHPALRRGSATETTPDLSKMSPKEMAKHYREVALPSAGGEYVRNVEA